MTTGKSCILMMSLGRIRLIDWSLISSNDIGGRGSPERLVTCLSRQITPSADMSLPRGNYDPRRVCINPFPEITLGKHKRTVGVYLAGALVRVTLIVVVI